MMDIPKHVPQIEWWSTPGKRAIRQAHERFLECTGIVSSLREMGYNATPNMVNRNYKLFQAWKEGRFPIGHLCKATGLRKKEGS